MVFLGTVVHHPDVLSGWTMPMTWADPTEVDVGPENCGVAPSSKRFSSALSGWTMPYDLGGPHIGRRRNGKLQSSVSTGRTTARHFPVELHMYKM